MMSKKHKIIDNFLNENDLKKVKSTIESNSMPWFYERIFLNNNKKYKIIDNFLDEKKLKIVKSSIESSSMPWLYEDEISEAKKKDKHGTFYLTHLAYINNKAHSDLFSIIGNMFINALKIKSLIRIKANFYPNQGQFVEHEYHVDYKFKHIGAIFSLNTCNGYTKLHDGTKIDSVENRLLIFDASTKHCSTNTTNAERRLNINFNYF